MSKTSLHRENSSHSGAIIALLVQFFAGPFAAANIAAPGMKIFPKKGRPL